MQCPTNNFFRYNATLCACNPGYFYNATDNTCSPFTTSGTDDFSVGSGVDYSINIPANIFAFDTIKKYTQSQGVFLEATAVMLASWLLFCFFVRFGKFGDGTTYWFRVRWWISRLDVSFATRHWLDDQKVVKKRKTELGGTFSIGSWILFIGLFAALLYQVISMRTIETHNVIATNAPDLSSFHNNMEFNITTISNMSCSNLQGLSNLVTGNPGFIDYRTAPISTFGSYSCHNTTRGPTITLKCENCQFIRDNLYISWQFVDLPNIPASAVGFDFKLTSQDRVHKKHVSFVSGNLRNGSVSSAKFVTYRGKDPNILQFNLFPRLYRNKHDLKLIQPLFHDFIPGSSFSDSSQLQDSLQRFNDGIVNTTLYVNFLSSYIVEVDNQSTLGPVGFLADLGGLFCVSFGIFFYFLVQFEYRFKRFRYEDSVMRGIRNRRKAQQRWDKLRKYVNFTWGGGMLPFEDGDFVENACSCCIAVPERKHFRTASNISFGNKFINHSQKVVKIEEEKKEDSSIMHAASANIPMPPSLEMRAGSEISIAEIEKNLKKLYEYNMMLREKLVSTQSTINDLTTKASESSS